ncbi:unnamed protein product, partial [Phaeothamnion confervicola]
MKHCVKKKAFRAHHAKKSCCAGQVSLSARSAAPSHNQFLLFAVSDLCRIFITFRQHVCWRFQVVVRCILVIAFLFRQRKPKIVSSWSSGIFCQTCADRLP